MNRRKFISKTVLGGASVLTLSGLNSSYIWGQTNADRRLPAILGGTKSHLGLWPDWPVWKSPDYDEGVLKVLRSGVWSRSKVTEEFESKWAELIGTKRCLSVVNGTNALVAALAQFNIGPGDEVIVPPYTFVATVQAVLMNGALPVFADVDPTTFQIDPVKIEEKITPRTKAILPVHILGIPADMTQIMAIATKHHLIVIEDACQAHLAEVSGKRVGSIGNAGCFSFQTSKNMPIGEGGAIVSNDSEFMDRCYSYHNLGFPYGSQPGNVSGGAIRVGYKIRFTEYQAAIGLVQMKNLEKETDIRWTNAQYLSKRIKDIPGVSSARLYPETTKAVYHLYPLLYNKNAFKGMSRALFLEALRAEGIPCSPGYTPLQTQSFIQAAFESKLYRKLYTTDDLNYHNFLMHNKCPVSDRICNEEAIWLTQNLLLGTVSDMDHIANAVEKIYRNADKIVLKFKKG
ncbi:DegT/DnrJ/EryC1/StrS family aminotransferase [Limibacterium fermenti]|jgi:dTDP-4-amino-4,6-dideoxygalactose transaminase|uniref:DegT/DnrJ/EryC1/StrS family aminotransferase n=1 Tax=Limibacterium fermenti TaxID=3229863 RepID=UPI000E918FD2|nr:glutamine--scyllo-inositol aminotransferase [Porphyromonadaceae bacterium]HBX21706.1 glutamine--scyllo-inositol aminotransferase [Porphyromonadaceae bacterium]HBX46989.1 glutamine--scyllo-inositol aminotransferase [Porphyromonadaceae bacterium]